MRRAAIEENGNRPKLALQLWYEGNIGPLFTGHFNRILGA